MIIQIIATGIILFILGQLIVKVIKDKASIIKIAFWLIFWSIALIVIWLPTDIIDKFGELVGVGRGIDVLVYFSIILLFYDNLKLRSKIDSIQKDITKIVRKISKNNSQITK
jgi:hypothetical protein